MKTRDKIVRILLAAVALVAVGLATFFMLTQANREPVRVTDLPPSSESKAAAVDLVAPAGSRPPADPSAGPAPVSVPPAAPRPVSIVGSAQPAAKPIMPSVLRRELAELLKDDRPVSSDFMQRVAILVDKARAHGSLTRQVAATELYVDALTHAGERARAREVYGEYLDLLTTRNGADHAARVAQGRARELFEKDGDHLDALAHFDMIATRFPETEAGEHALFMTAKYYERQDLLPQAAAAYARVVESVPDSRWANRAYRQWWNVLTRMERYSEALTVMNDFAERCDSDEDVVSGRFNVGCTLYWMGVAHYPDAMREFRAIQADSPDHPHAADATRMMARIQNEMLADAHLQLN